MFTTSTTDFIQDCVQKTNNFILQVEVMRSKGMEALQWKRNSETWSVLECLEHLNLYGEYYLPKIKEAIDASSTKAQAHVRSGWLGNYFAESMLPKEGGKKMKTFNDKNPIYGSTDIQVIDRFLQQQQTMLRLLHASEHVNMNKIRIPVSISPWIRLKLCDVFRFTINHSIRHLHQINCILQEQEALFK